MFPLNTLWLLAPNAVLLPSVCVKVSSLATFAIVVISYDTNLLE